MSDKFVNPNLHVILIHYPLAMITVGTLIELFAFLWRRSSFRAAGRWMILIGVVALGPALTTGLFALGDVNRSTNVGDDASWADVRAASPVQHQAWDMMRHHAWYLAAASGVFLLITVIWLACSDRARSQFHFLFLLLLVGSLGLTVAGAWNGGEMIYRHGVAVNSAADQPSADAGETSPPKGLEPKLAYYSPPLQTHVILAGLVVTLSLVLIGLSIRAGDDANAILETSEDAQDINAALDPTIRPASVPAIDRPSAPPPILTPPFQVARFWVIVFLIALATGLTGWWTLAHNADIWSPRDLFHMVTDHETAGGYRLLAHGILTGVIVLSLLIIAIIARFSIARRVLISLFIILLVLALWWQVWIGSLMLLDTTSGSLTRFNPATAATTNP